MSVLWRAIVIYVFRSNEKGLIVYQWIVGEKSMDVSRLKPSSSSTRVGETVNYRCLSGLKV